MSWLPCYDFIVTSFMLIFLKNVLLSEIYHLLIVVYFHDRFLQIQIKKGYTALCTQVIRFLFEIPMCVIYGVQQGYDK